MGTEANKVLMMSVISKTITDIGHCNETKEMFVKFKTNPLPYKYSDITQEECNSIRTDVSVGSKLRKVVAGKLYAKLSVESPDFKRLKY
jgi:hypothetical protein